MTDQDWLHRAACLTQDPELFFPIGSTGPALIQLEQATQVCRGCPVRPECLQVALGTGMDHGVWGGIGEEERRALKRRTNRSRLLQANTAAKSPDRSGTS